ncbi:MAG: hypothetical protein JWM71_601, partial [Solirubrobacteraceae bacterium]|nr:hypothetical protein [Solirubrobacteraceae bacterium]
LAACALVAAPFAVLAALRLGHEMHRATVESAYYADLPHAIDRAGGAHAVIGCGAVFTSAFDTQAVARDLHVQERDVHLSSRTAATAVVRRGTPVNGGVRYRVLARTGHWVIETSCSR